MATPCIVLTLGYKKVLLTTSWSLTKIAPVKEMTFKMQSKSKQFRTY